MAERFYVNLPLALGPVDLRGPEAHHLAQVRRLRPGELVSLFNGDGREYQAEIRAIGKRAVQLEVLSEESPDCELPHALTVACPLPKGDRGQFLIEKLTELGVTRYVPLRTQRSMVHPGETRLEKLQRYVIEASKQCGRNVLMRIAPITDWDTFGQQVAVPARKFQAHPGGEPLLPNPVPADTVIAVGPEGGFTPEEVQLGRHRAWQTVDLGPRLLRIETAAIALAAHFSIASRLQN